MPTLYAVNPTKHKKHHHKKPRSAAQKAATARMLAVRFGHRNPSKVMTKFKQHMPAMRGTMGAVMNMLKGGAIGGAGAVANDILMGYTAKVLPASISSPLDSTGGMNFGYFGVKGTLAVLLGLFGRRIMPAPIAGQMAEGALSVLAYTILRPMVPAAVTLGYMNPAPTMRPAMGKYLSNAGAYQSIGVRSAQPSVSDSRGARASQVVSMIGNRRLA